MGAVTVPGGLQVGIELGAKEGDRPEVGGLRGPAPLAALELHDGLGVSEGELFTEPGPDGAEVGVGRLELGAGFAVEGIEPGELPLGGLGGSVT